MKTSLKDLNNYLFEELERLNDDETLDQDNNLDKELKRAKAISNIGSTIVNNAKTIIDGFKLADELGMENVNNVLKLGYNDEEVDERTN